MYFKLPYTKLADAPLKLLQTSEAKLISHETASTSEDNIYKFSFRDWQRLDSYNNPQNVRLEDAIDPELVTFAMGLFPTEHLYGWSLSFLPANTAIADHVDRMLLHRFCKRVIIPLSTTPDVLNWSYERDRTTKRFYTLDYGGVYRLNTAITHGLYNNSNLPRRAVYLDIIDDRLYNRFKNHPEMQKVILANALGEIYVF